MDPLVAYGIGLALIFFGVIVPIVMLVFKIFGKEITYLQAFVLVIGLIFLKSFFGE